MVVVVYDGRGRWGVVTVVVVVVVGLDWCGAVWCGRDDLSEHVCPEEHSTSADRQFSAPQNHHP